MAQMKKKDMTPQCINRVLKCAIADSKVLSFSTGFWWLSLHFCFSRDPPSLSVTDRIPVCFEIVGEHTSYNSRGSCELLSEFVGLLMECLNKWPDVISKHKAPKAAALKEAAFLSQHCIK